MDEALPKLHDILKLTGKNKSHRCPEWEEDLVKVNLEIKKALKHHCVSRYWNKKEHKEDCYPFPLDKETLCIHLADIKAATISRKLRIYKYRSYRTFRIWKDIKKNRDELELGKSAFQDFPNIITELITTTNPQALYEKLLPEFLNRSEDAGGCAFASLHTHNELTGLWTRFFIENKDYLGIPDQMTDPREYRRIIYRFVKKQIAMVRFRLTTHGKLSRLRDTKLIKDIPNILEEVASALKGVVVYELPEEILLITVPSEVQAIKARAEKVLGFKTNYFLETTVVNSALANREFLHNYNAVFGPYQDNLYPYLPPEIASIEDNEASHRAILCDMCQMAPAVKVYPREIYRSDTMAEPVEEFLCEGCLEIRQDADKARKLAAWEEEGEALVAFFKVSLDLGQLVAVLKEMFAQAFDFKSIIDEDLGFSILKEFLQDYEGFLESFRETVLRYEDYSMEQNHELILKNLFCIKINKRQEVRPLISDYVELFNSAEFFPRFIPFCHKNGRPLPVKLSVTISSVKYPFMDHWQFLDSPDEDINIYSVPQTRLKIGIDKYGYLRDVLFQDRRISTALHKLAEIEERAGNEFLLTAAMLEMKNDLKELARPLITTRELTIKQVLAYYKIMRN